MDDSQKKGVYGGGARGSGTPLERRTSQNGGCHNDGISSHGNEDFAVTTKCGAGARVAKMGLN